MRRAYRGRILTPRTAAAGPLSLAGAPALAYFEDGLLVVGSDGRIAAVEAFDERAAVGPVTDLRPCVLVPGFVDARLHVAHARVAGSASAPLLAWLERVAYPEEVRFRDDAYARTVAGEVVARLVEAGTTTACVVSTAAARATDVLFETVAASGLRAVVGLALMDQGGPEALRTPVGEALAACRDLADRWHGHDRGRIAVALAPRSALACSRALLEGAAAVAAERGLAVHTRVAESAREEDETRVVHPWCGDGLGALDAVGLVGPRTVLAHAVHLDEPGWDRLAARGARVAHCPDSNFFLGSGRMPLERALARGVPVALATDLGAGRSASVRRAMSRAHDSALCAGLRVAPETLFSLATLGGARALGLDADLGSLEVGKEADVAAFALPKWVRTAADVLAHLVFADDDVRAERVLVRGRKLVAAPPKHVPRPPPKTPA